MLKSKSAIYCIIQQPVAEHFFHENTTEITKRSKPWVHIVNHDSISSKFEHFIGLTVWLPPFPQSSSQCLRTSRIIFAPSGLSYKACHHWLWKSLAVLPSSISPGSLSMALLIYLPVCDLSLLGDNCPPVGTELTFSQVSSHLPLLCIDTQTWEMPGWLCSTSPDFAPEHLQLLCSAALSSLFFSFSSFTFSQSAVSGSIIHTPW